MVCRPQTAVEMVVEQHLRRAADLVGGRASRFGAGRTGEGRGHAPILADQPGPKTPRSPAVRTFTSLDDVAASVGEELGSSDWLTVDQERVDRFAEATGDHVDPRRRREGKDRAVRRHHRPRLPHALAAADAGRPGVRPGDPRGQAQLRPQQGALPRPRACRFPHPGARESGGRGRPSRRQAATLGWTIEIEDHPKPGCVAETVVLLLP